MASAEDLLEAHMEQQELDTEETLEMLVEFVSESCAKDAISAVCECIDAEELTDEFAAWLRARGLTIEGT